jgi:hypothetical protein
MSTSVNNDSFLQRQGLQVEDSEFLRRVLREKAAGKKEEYNLRDLHGRRLDRNWQPGDSLWSVVGKVMRQRVENLLDPDTYSVEKAREGKEVMLREKVKILGMLIFMMVPITAYFNILKPKLDRVRRLYFLQFYNKMGFFNRELGVKTKPLSHKDLQDKL